MDRNSGNSDSETINVGDVDITINVHHHDGEESRQSDGGYNGPVQPAPRPAYVPPAHKRRTPIDIFSYVVLCFCALSVISVFLSYSQIAPSTHSRRAITPSAANQTGYYTDDAGWIGDESTLLKGLKEFQKITGVQPYVYIANAVNGSQSPTAQQLNAFTDSLYDELFSDEAHMLLVFLPSGSGFIDNYKSGAQAATVIDTEAEKILHDYIYRYYVYYSYPNEEVLSKAFADAADGMMGVSVSPWFVLIVCSAISALVIVLYVRRHRKVREAFEAQQTEEMLKIPLEKFGDLEAEELAKKYEDKV